MDLTRPVTYRGADLNTVTPTVGRPGITGCMVETANIRELDYVQFTEKRRLADGHDTVEPYLGIARIILTGTVFGQTRGATFDALQVLKEAFNPVKALMESPSTKGFVPFVFTNNELRSVNCRPQGLRYTFDHFRSGSNAKVTGTEDLVGLAFNWTVELLVNIADLLDCGEWPVPEPPPTPPPVGYNCSPNGYIVPTGPLITDIGPFIAWDCVGSNGAYGPPVSGVNYGLATLYDRNTYHYEYTTTHVSDRAITMRFLAEAGALAGQEFMGGVCAHHSTDPPLRYAASGSFAIGGTTCRLRTWQLAPAHTNYSGCSRIGIYSTAVLTYQTAQNPTGCDPRFNALPPCP